jgi:hypothetical protein
MPGFDEKIALQMMGVDNNAESIRVQAAAEQGGANVSPRMDRVVSDAVATMPAGADHDSVVHTAAAQIMAENEGMDIETATNLATSAVVRRAWTAAGTGAMTRVDESFLRESVIYTADPATGARAAKPLSEAEFQQRASRYGIGPQRASAIYRQLLRPPTPDAGRAQVGTTP